MDENIKYKNINMNTRYLKIAIVVASFFALGFFSGKAQGFDENGGILSCKKHLLRMVTNPSRKGRLQSIK